MPCYKLTLYCSETTYHSATVVVDAPTAEAAKQFILDTDGADPANVMMEHGKETMTDGFDAFGVDDDETIETDEAPDYVATELETSDQD
jgi:hypothetical protein